MTHDDIEKDHSASVQAVRFMSPSQQKARTQQAQLLIYYLILAHLCLKLPYFHLLPSIDAKMSL